MARIRFVIVLLAAATLSAAFTLQAQAFDTPAKQALLLDFSTGAVLLEKNADELMYPSSMTKMMTVHLLFEKLRDGSLSLEDTLPVSEKAWRKGGSKMFVEVGKNVRVEDLIRGITVQSGNDATIVVAEGLSGSEDAFAEEMTTAARRLGMTGSQFRNASGWPDPDHYTTARDLAILAMATIREFPDFYHYYAEEVFTFNGIKQRNRNPLLYKGIGADGLKTGHTEAAGYGLAASAERKERRLVLILNGMDSESQRATESERVMAWGFREWNNYTLFQSGDTAVDAPVWLGESSTVPLIMGDDMVLTLPRKARQEMKVAVRFEEPIPAPVSAGTPVGTVVVTAPGTETIEVPVLAGADVAVLSPFGRVAAAFEYLVWGGGE